MLFYQEAERLLAATLLFPNKLPLELFPRNYYFFFLVMSAFLGITQFANKIGKRFEFSYLDGTNIEKRSQGL